MSLMGRNCGGQYSNPLTARDKVLICFYTASPFLLAGMIALFAVLNERFLQ